MKRLLQKAAGTLGLRVSYTLLTFVTSVVLARVLGRAGFGTYTYTTSWVYLLTIPATLGFDGLVGREIAIYQTKLDWARTSGLLRWANVLVILAALFTASVGAVIALWQGGQTAEPQIVWCFLLVMLSLPAMALRNIRRGSMRGLHQIVWGLLPEMLVAPVLLLVLVGLGAVFLETQFTAVWAVGAYAITTFVTLVISAELLERTLPLQVKTCLPQYHRFEWLKQAWPFMFLESIHVLNARADILMLGAINGVGDAGVYAPVNRGAQLIVFILMAFNGPLSPTIAGLYADGKRRELQQILRKTSRVCLLISAIAAAGLWLFGNQYLLVFGLEYVQGLSALRILCVGQVLYVFVGLAPMVLSMTGHAQFTAMSGLIGAITNLILNFLLIPRYGVNGAAIATTCAMLLAGVLNTIWVYRKVGVHPNIFGRS
ncbi:MAG: flippase [Cyanobacteria bacterium J06650_10]